MKHHKVESKPEKVRVSGGGIRSCKEEIGEPNAVVQPNVYEKTKKAF